MKLLAATVAGLLIGATPAHASSEPPLVTQLTATASVNVWQDAQAPSPAARPFAQGTWTFQTYGSAGVFDSDKGEIYTGHIGFGYHFFDDLSVNLEGVGGWVTPERDDHGGVGGIDLLLRWHYLNRENFSLYIDGGVGFQLATTNYPSDSHHNFRPQFGIGGTLRIWESARLMAGVRWLHISNAGTTDGNDGFDGAQFYGGVMIPF